MPSVLSLSKHRSSLFRREEDERPPSTPPAASLGTGFDGLRANGFEGQG